MDLHRQRIQENFYIDRRRKGDPEREQLRIQEKTCIGGSSRWAQLIDENGRKPKGLESGREQEKLKERTETDELENGRKPDELKNGGK